MNFLKQFSVFLITFLLSINTNYAQYQVVNVKAFGAIGDGLTDDTDVIIKAKKVVERTGGTLFFPKGTYLTNIVDIRPSPGVKILFKGEKGTIIQKRIEDPIDVALFFCEVPTVQLKFENLILEGNLLLRERHWKTINSKTIDVHKATSGIFVYNVQALEVNHCEIRNFHGDGIAMYQGDVFNANNNIIENMSVNGIRTHKVDSSIIEHNNIKNVGIVFSDIILNDKKIKYDTRDYYTNFGDGILDVSRQSYIRNNVIHNSGRIGIVHDLSKDVGYQNSKVEVIGNEVVLNSELINSSNPPAGMWFEQSSEVLVKKNKIKIIKSAHPITSGMRFYDVGNRVVVEKNIVISETNQGVKDAIGIFEPNHTRSILIENNQISGKFRSAITFSYESKVASVRFLKMQENNFTTLNNNDQFFLTISIYGHNEFPNEMIITGNNMDMGSGKMFNFSYFGHVTNKSHFSKLILNNNMINGFVSNELPKLKYLSISNE